jgi:hypothetical protein
MPTSDYLVLTGITHRLGVQRNPDGTYVLEAWSPDVLHQDGAKIALTATDAADLADFLEGAPAR